MKYWFFTSVILIFFTAHAQDVYEQRVFEIYQNYQQTDITDEAWETQFNELREDIYEIQSGDNLWDISKIFFGDGHYWSKLWSVNDKITNPHEIEPGSVIRFVRGSEDAPPVISTEKKSQNLLWTANEKFENVAQVDDNSDNDDDEVLTTRPQTFGKDPVYLLQGAPTLPKSKKHPKPVLRRYPKSLQSKTETNLKFDKSGFSFEGFPEAPKEAQVVLSSYVVGSWPDKSGSIIENEGENEVAPDFSYSYVQMDDRADVGEVFTVVRYLDDLEFAGEDEKVVQVLGQLKITDRVSGEDSRFRAQIIKSIAPIQKNDLILRTPLPVVTLSNEGEPRNFASQIIGGMANPKQIFFQEGSVIYLNKGQSDGLTFADLLAVSAIRTSRKENAIVREVPVYSGLVKIVSLSEHRATGLVVQARDELRVGDETGQTVKSKDVTESESLDDVIE